MCNLAAGLATWIDLDWSLHWPRRYRYPDTLMTKRPHCKSCELGMLSPAQLHSRQLLDCFEAPRMHRPEPGSPAKIVYEGTEGKTERKKCDHTAACQSGDIDHHIDAPTWGRSTPDMVQLTSYNSHH
eukprot:2131173-Amphidinium_carterae.1